MFHNYILNNSLPFTKVLVTLPWSFLSSIEVFLDFETKFSFLTIQGLSRSTTQKSASLSIERFPLLIPKIFAGLDVRAWIIKKENLISKSKNTSIEDKKLQGKVTNTFVKGKELFKI